MVEASSRHPVELEATSDAAPSGQTPQNRYAILLIGLTLLISIAAAIVVQPHVGSWLQSRSAFRNLSSADYDARIDAIRQLRSVGENAEPELISLLHHPDEGVRSFAAGELANGPHVAPDIVEAFLVALDEDRHVAEIGAPGCATNLFFKHAKSAAGPLTPTDRRIIAWLRRRLNATDPEQSGSAAWALTGFADRDPSLREPLAAWLKNATFFYQYIALRELASSDPSIRDRYVNVLLSGLASSNPNDQSNALYGLTHLENAPVDLKSRLEARRKKATNAGEIARIDQAIEHVNRATILGEEQPHGTGTAEPD
jgi:hypothetical protein